MAVKPGADRRLVGARILDRLLELGWLKSASGSRALQLTSSGRTGLSEIFEIEINNTFVPGGTWLQANSILTGRLARISAEFTW